jgi:hypothetical protein
MKSSSVCFFFAISHGASLWASGPDRIDVKLTPAMREYCHIVQFPQGWSIQSKDVAGQVLFFNYKAEYEFRIEGLLGTEFLVGGFTKVVGHRYDTKNRYRIDLSDPTAPLLAADSKAWEAGAVVPLVRKSILNSRRRPEGDDEPEINGFRFRKTGALWAQPDNAASRLSPTPRGSYF